MQDIIVYILLVLTVTYVLYKTYKRVFPDKNESICGTCGGCDLKESCGLQQNLEKRT
jgi:positive regulator of sigma E activity